MANILVTGGAGFIGSNIAEELLKKDHNIRILDNFTTGNMKNVEHIKNRIEIIKGDITDLKTVKKSTEGMDYIFHEAALTSVSASIKNPTKTNSINIKGTLNILLASRDSAVKRVIFASSCAVYGNLPENPKKESSDIDILSPYALTKTTGEKYCRLFYRLYGLETVCLRYFNVYGPGQNPESEYAAVIPKFITAFLKNQQPVIYGTGEQTRDFVFVSDVVQANTLAIKMKKADGDVFNIGTGRATSVNELFSILNLIFGRHMKPLYKDTRKGDIKHSLADITKAGKILGYEPKYSLEIGIRKTIEYLKAGLGD